MKYFKHDNFEDFLNDSVNEKKTKTEKQAKKAKKSKKKETRKSRRVGKDIGKDINTDRKEIESVEQEAVDKQDSVDKATSKLNNRMAVLYRKFLKSIGKAISKNEDMLEDENTQKKIIKGIEEIFKANDLSVNINYLNTIYNKKRVKNENNKGASLVHKFITTEYQEKVDDAKLAKQMAKKVEEMSVDMKKNDVDNAVKAQPATQVAHKSVKAETKAETKYISLGEKIVQNGTSPLLEKGIESGYVGLLTYLLKKGGRKIEITTQFDGSVEKIVIEYQKANQLNGDGIVGKKSWSKLLNKNITKGKRLPKYPRGWNSKKTSNVESTPSTSATEKTYTKEQILAMLERVLIVERNDNSFKIPTKRNKETSTKKDDPNYDVDGKPFAKEEVFTYKIDIENKSIIELLNGEESDRFTFDELILNSETNKLSIKGGEKDDFYQGVGKQSNTEADTNNLTKEQYEDGKEQIITEFGVDSEHYKKFEEKWKNSKDNPSTKEAEVKASETFTDINDDGLTEEERGEASPQGKKETQEAQEEPKTEETILEGEQTIELTWDDDEDRSFKIQDGYLEEQIQFQLQGFLNGLVDALDYISTPDFSDVEEALKNLELVKDVKFKKSKFKANNDTDTNLLNAFKDLDDKKDVGFIDFIKIAYDKDEDSSILAELTELDGDTLTSDKEKMKEVINKILDIFGENKIK